MTTKWPPQGFVYGIDVERFQDSDGDGVGDLAGLATRLDYVATLGASWVWLYPMGRGDGVDPRLGTLDDLRTVIEGCHKRGLSVMIDLVTHGQNVADDDVFDELVRGAATWVCRGVDGFRIAGAVPKVAPSPTEGTGVAPGQLLSRLRARLNDVGSDVILVGEADVPPDTLGEFTTHRRVDAVVDFSLNSAMLLALAREDPAPLHRAVAELDRSVQASARINFVRKVDELDLGQLREAERREVFAAFGAEDGALCDGRLRRAWRPMMGDERRFRMSLSLLFALPGVPLLLYGQELGIGDDLGAPGGDACRPVMQWRSSSGGGFTGADSSLVLPAQRNGPFDFTHVNARDQTADDSSNLVLTRRLARLRARAGTAANPARLRPLPHAPGVFALSVDGCLTLHNLSAQPADVFEAYGAEPLLYERWNGHRLGPYGFAWFHL